MEKRWFGVLFVAVALLGSACGDDEEKSAKDAGTDSGSAGTGAGTGGTGGTGGETLACGTATCMAPELDLSGIPGLDGLPIDLGAQGFGPEVCCAGEDKDVCGVTQSMLIPSGECLAQGQEGEPNAACPNEEQMISVFGFPFSLPLTGCCKATNECGVDLSILGVGCLERTEASRIGMMGAAQADASLDALEAIPCVFGGADDGGVDDAGAN